MLFTDFFPPGVQGEADLEHERNVCKKSKTTSVILVINNRNGCSFRVRRKTVISMDCYIFSFYFFTGIRIKIRAEI